MAGNPSRAYLVGSVDLRDRLIAELAAVGITAVAGGGVTGVGREKAKDGPRWCSSGASRSRPGSC